MQVHLRKLVVLYEKYFKDICLIALSHYVEATIERSNKVFYQIKRNESSKLTDTAKLNLVK